MPTKTKPPNPKAIRGWGITLIIVGCVTWLLCNTSTVTFYMYPPTLLDILWGVACWLPIPSLGCAIASLALADKSRFKAARTLAIIAGALLALPLGFFLYIILFISY
ncbi:MAG: hypothetical protein FWC27_14205 [Firmicutes bacterium]|nr:hypothetical protein [Bacillota bacterium]